MSYLLGLNTVLCQLNVFYLEHTFFVCIILRFGLISLLPV